MDSLTLGVVGLLCDLVNLLGEYVAVKYLVKRVLSGELFERSEIARHLNFLKVERVVFTVFERSFRAVVIPTCEEIG